MGAKKLFPHDRFIKKFLSDKSTAIDFFKNNLPSFILKSTKLNTLKVLPDTFIDEKLKLRLTDILYIVDFKIKEKSEKGFLYLLVEHASSPDPLIPFRMLEYQIKIWDKYINDHKNTKYLPLIYPQIIYNGKNPYHLSLDIFDLFGKNKDLAKKYLFKPLNILDLTKATDDEISKFENFKLAALSAKHIRDSNILEFVKEFLVIEFSALDNPNDRWKIYAIMNYIFEVSKISDPKALYEVIEQGLKPETKEKIMTIADYLRNEGKKEAETKFATIADQLRKEGLKAGIEKGMEKGMEKGKKEKEKEMINVMLSKNIPIKTISEISGWKIEEIKKLAH